MSINTNLMNANTMNTIKDTILNYGDGEHSDLPWEIIESYFQGQHLQRLVRHQLESYNNFI